MEVKGVIKSIGTTEQITDTFSKREIIIDISDNPTYPSPVKFETHKDKTALLDKFNIGDTVDVSFNMNGKEYKDKNGDVKYFTTLAIYKITESLPY
jgi:hypothetical protein